MIDKARHIDGVADHIRTNHIPKREQLDQAVELLNEYASTFREIDEVDYTIKAKYKVPVLCKYHEEKTPSCNVDFDTKTFYCFGCGASGKVIMRGYTEFDLERDEGDATV